MVGSLVPHSGKPSPWTRCRGFSALPAPTEYFLTLYPPPTPSAFHSAAFSLHFSFWHPSAHLVQVDSMKTHLSRSKLWKLGQLQAPSASWGHTAGTEGTVHQRHASPPCTPQRGPDLISPSEGPCILLLEDQPPPLPPRPHHGCPASPAPPPHLGSWARREMEASRLAVAAAGQGVVGLRSRGGRRGCTKRLARKASGWEQEKRASEERTEGEGGSPGND